MKVLFIAALVVTTFAKVPEVLSWDDWKAAFGKSYTTAEENDSKRDAFNQNIGFIVAHNERASRGEETYRLGVNEFSDLSREEFRSIYLGEHKHIYPKNYKELATDTAPSSVDWRAKGAVTPIKNQGQCGSCWSFSTTGSIEGAVAIKSGKLTSLSEQQLMDCSKSYGDNSCQGGLMDNAFKYVIHNKGLDSEADYPYKMKNEACETSKQSRHISDISGYHDVQQSDAQMEAAVAIGPVSVAIEADQSSFQHYRSGTFTGPCGTKLDHGVLAVGYTSEYWIVKNSWGATWGDQGFIMMGRGSKYGSSGICGILESASYPVAGAQPGPPGPPSPTPTPGPAPSMPYYEDPATTGSCNSGETAIRIQNVAGAFCSPKCQGFLRRCPALPSGFTAQAECALQDQQGDHFCGLICDTSASGQCDSALQSTCKAAGQGTVGICTYDDDAKTPALRLTRATDMKTAKHIAQKEE